MPNSDRLEAIRGLRLGQAREDSKSEPEWAPGRLVDLGWPMQSWDKARRGNSPIDKHIHNGLGARHRMRPRWKPRVRSGEGNREAGSKESRPPAVHLAARGELNLRPADLAAAS